MAKVIITLKIMPDDPDIDLNKILEKSTKMISEFGGNVGKHDIEPVAFGIKALKIVFVMDESLGSTEELEKEIAAITGVSSVDMIDIRRTIG